MHRSLPGEIIQIEVSSVKAESTIAKTKEPASRPVPWKLYG